MEIVLNKNVAENYARIEGYITNFKGVTGCDYVLAFNKLQTRCGIYWVEYNVSGYIEKLNSNGQHGIYLGKADKRGRIQRIKL